MDAIDRFRPKQAGSSPMSMNIEKVSKFVSQTTPSRSGEGSFSRQILLSIPRLRWLETDIDSCTYYSQYTPDGLKTHKEEKKIREKSFWAKTLAGKPLSPQETKIKKMLETMTIEKVASTLKVSHITIKSCIASIKAKEDTSGE
jgi:hypothetical protein